MLAILPSWVRFYQGWRPRAVECAGQVSGDKRRRVVSSLPPLSPGTWHRYQQIWHRALGRVMDDALGKTQRQRMACCKVALVLERQNQLFDWEVIDKCRLAPIEFWWLDKAVVRALMIRPRHCAARATAGEPRQVFLTRNAKATSLGLALAAEQAGPFDGAQ